MSHRRRGGLTGHAKKSQILVEETVIDTTEESDSSETLVNQTDNVDSVYQTSFILDKNTEARQTPLRKSQGRKTNNEEEIKKLAFCLDRIKNKKIRFLSHKEFLEKLLHDKLMPNGLKINLEATIGNQNEEFVKVKETDSKLQSSLPSTEYSTIKEQVSKNQELTIQQIRKKKTRKYRRLKCGEQIPEKQTETRQ